MMTLELVPLSRFGTIQLNGYFWCLDDYILLIFLSIKLKSFYKSIYIVSQTQHSIYEKIPVPIGVTAQPFNLNHSRAE